MPYKFITIIFIFNKSDLQINWKFIIETSMYKFYRIKFNNIIKITNKIAQNEIMNINICI